MNMNTFRVQTTKDHPSTKGQHFAAFCPCDDDEATTFSTATMQQSNVSACGETHRILQDYFPVHTVGRSLETDPAVFAAHVRSLGRDIDSVAEATDEVIISYIQSYVEQPQNHDQPTRTIAVPMEHADEGSSMTTDGSGGTKNSQQSNDSLSARTATRRILREHAFPIDLARRSLETNPAGLVGSVRFFGSNIHSVAEATDDVIISSIRSYVEQPQKPARSLAVPMEHIDEGSAMTTDGSGDIDCPDRMSESEPSGPNDIMSTDYTMMDVSEGNGGTGGRKNSG